MARTITVTLANGQQHTYQNVPENVTADQVIARAQNDFPGVGIRDVYRAPSQDGEAAATPAPTLGRGTPITDRAAPDTGAEEPQGGFGYLTANRATLPPRQDPGTLADIVNYMGSTTGAQTAGFGRALEDLPRITRSGLADPAGMLSTFGGLGGAAASALARMGIESAYEAVAPNADEEWRASVAPVANPLIEAGERTQRLYTPYTGTPTAEYSAAREAGEGVPYALWRGARAALIGASGSTPTLAAGLVAGRFGGPRAAAAVMGVPSTSAAYAGIRETQEREGIDDPSRAFTAALASGLMDATTGLGGRAVSTATRNALRRDAERGISGALREIGKTGLSESGTEMVQNVIEQLGGGQDPFAEESLFQTLDAALTGFAGGVVLGTPIEGLNRRQQSNLRRAFGEQASLRTVDVNVPGDGGRAVPTTLDILSAPDANGNVVVRTAEGTPYVDSLSNIEAMRPAPAEGETRENLADVLADAERQNADNAALTAAVNALLSDPNDGSARGLLRARLRSQHGIPDYLADQIVDSAIQTAATSAPQTGQEAAATSVVNSINRAAAGKNKAVKAAQEQAMADAEAAVAATVSIPPEYQSAIDLVNAVDARGVSFNTPKINAIARSLGLDVSRTAKPEDTINRIRAAVERYTPTATLDETATAPAQPKRRGKKAPATATPTATAPLPPRRFQPLAQNEATTRFPKDAAARNAFFNGAVGTTPEDFFAGRKNKVTKAEVEAFNAGRAYGTEQGQPVSATELTLTRPKPQAATAAPVVDRKAAFNEANRRFDPKEEDNLATAFYNAATGMDRATFERQGPTEGELNAWEQGLEWAAGTQRGGAGAGVPSTGGRAGAGAAAAPTAGTDESGVGVAGGVAGGPATGKGQREPTVTKVAPGEARGIRETRTGMMGTQRGRPVEGAAALTEGMRAEQELYAELEAARQRREISDEEMAQAINTLRPPVDRDGNFDNEAYKALPANEKSAWGSAIAAQKAVDEQGEVVSAIPKEVLGQPNPERVDAEAELAKRQRSLDDAQRNLVSIARDKVGQKTTERKEAQTAIRELLKDPNLTEEQRRDLQIQLRENKVDRKYRRTGAGAAAGAAAGVAKDKVEAHIAKLASNLRAQLDVTVVGSFEELPDYVMSALERDNALDAQGTILPGGGIYILAYNLDSLDDATATFYHEVLGHMGLSSLFHTRLDRALQIIYDNNKTLREETDQWLKDRPGAYTNTPNRKLRALEEILANRSEGGVLKASVWDKLIGVFRDFGRRMGMRLEYSDTEVRNLLTKAHDQMVRGPRPSNIMQGLRYVEKNMTPGSRFSGKLKLRHSSANPNLRITAVEELTPEDRYDGGGGSVFGDSGMYMADPTDTKWPEMLYWANKSYDVDASFDNAFVLTPDTLAEFVSLVQPDMDGSQVPYFNAAERLRGLGYDGLIVRDMDEMYDEYNALLGEKLSPIEDEADRRGVPMFRVPGYTEATQAALREWGARYGLNIPATASEHVVTNLQDQIVALYPERQVEIQSEPYSAYVQKYMAKKAKPKTAAEEAADIEARAAEKTRKGVEKLQRSLEAGGVRNPDAIAQDLTSVTEAATEQFHAVVDKFVEPLTGAAKTARRVGGVTSVLINGLRKVAPEAADIADNMVETVERMGQAQRDMTKALGKIGRGLQTFIESDPAALARLAYSMQIARNFSHDPTLHRNQADALANDRYANSLRNEIADLSKKIKAEKNAAAKKELTATLNKTKLSLRKRELDITEVWKAWEALGKLPGGQFQWRQQQQFYKDAGLAYETVSDVDIDMLDVPETVKQKLKEAEKGSEDPVTDAGHEYPGVKASLLDPVYFPYMRFGDHVAIVKWSGKNGGRRRLEFDSMAARAAWERKFKRDNRQALAEGKVSYTFTNKADLSAEDASESENAALRDVFQAIEKSVPKGSTDEQAAAFKKQLKDRVYQVFLKRLPERSLKKQFIHAKLVEGQSPDVARVFADYAQRYASQLPKLMARPQLERMISEGVAALDDMQGVDPLAQERAREVFGLISQHVMDEFSAEELSGPIKYLNLTAFGALMGSVVATAIQFTAFPLGAVPKLLAKYPVAAPVLIARYLEVLPQIPTMPVEVDPMTGDRVLTVPSFGNTPFVKNNKLRKKLFDELRARGLFSQHVTDLSLGELAAGKPSTLRAGVNRFEEAVRISAIPMSAADQLMFELTGLLFAELAYKKSGNLDDSIKTAVRDTKNALGNFSEVEQPNVFRGPWGRIFRFLRSYSVQMAVTYGRLFHNSFKGAPYQTRKEAFAELVMRYFMVGLFAGPAGTFLSSVGFFLAEALFSLLMDDDEENEFRNEHPLAFRKTFSSNFTGTEFDAKQYLLYDLIPSYFGTDTDMTRSLQKGVVSNALNIDLSGRVGHDALFIRDWRSGDTTLQTMFNFLSSNLTPQFSVGVNVVNAYDAAVKGDYARAYKGFLPSWFRGPALSLEYAEEGIRTGRNIESFSPERIERGFAPPRPGSGDPLEGLTREEARGMFDGLTVIAMGGQPLDIALAYERDINPLFDVRRYSERRDEIKQSIRHELAKNNPDPERLSAITTEINDFNSSLPYDLRAANYIDYEDIAESLIAASRDNRLMGYPVEDDEAILLARERGLLTDEQADLLSLRLAIDRARR